MSFFSPPPQLSDIKTIEVLRLERGHAFVHPGTIVNVRNYTATNESVTAILLHWNGLELGESARCHQPPIALRLFSGGGLRGEATVCWGCDNIYWYAPGSNRELFAFDAKESNAQLLYKLLSSFLPNPLEEQMKVG